MFSEASLVFAVFFPRGAEQQLSKASMKKKKKINLSFSLCLSFPISKRSLSLLCQAIESSQAGMCSDPSARAVSSQSEQHVNLQVVPPHPLQHFR